MNKINCNWYNRTHPPLKLTKTIFTLMLTPLLRSNAVNLAKEKLNKAKTPSLNLSQRERSRRKKIKNQHPLLSFCPSSSRCSGEKRKGDPPDRTGRWFLQSRSACGSHNFIYQKLFTCLQHTSLTSLLRCMQSPEMPGNHSSLQKKKHVILYMPKDSYSLWSYNTYIIE